MFIHVIQMELRETRRECRWEATAPARSNRAGVGLKNNGQPNSRAMWYDFSSWAVTSTSSDSLYSISRWLFSIQHRKYCLRPYTLQRVCVRVCLCLNVDVHDNYMYTVCKSYVSVCQRDRKSSSFVSCCLCDFYVGFLGVSAVFGTFLPVHRYVWHHVYIAAMVVMVMMMTMTTREKRDCENERRKDEAMPKEMEIETKERNYSFKCIEFVCVCVCATGV